MSSEIHLSQGEHHLIRHSVVALGIAALATSAIVTYALIKDSGETVTGLYKEIWDATENRREHFKSSLMGLGEVSIDAANHVSDSLKNKLQPDFDGLKSLSKSVASRKWWEK